MSGVDRFLILLLIPWWGVPLARGGEGMRDIEQAQARLKVESNTPGVEVFMDTLSLGVTPLVDRAIDTGKHIFRFVHPRGKSWFHPSIIETLVVQPSDHLERTINFPIIYHITSEPYGAEVRVADTLVGRTPYLLAAVSMKGLVTLKKDGYEEVAIVLTPDQTEVHAVLRALSSTNEERTSRYLSTEESKNAFPIYLTTSATVVTGVAAAYFKIKADRYYSDYQRTGDPGTLDRVHRLDTFSGISLVASELSLFMLTYILLSH